MRSWKRAKHSEKKDEQREGKKVVSNGEINCYFLFTNSCPVPEISDAFV